MPEQERGQFELLPNDGTVTSADDQLELALGNIPDPSQPSGGPRPFGRSWAFDFTTGQFVRRGQGPAEVTGLANLRQWIEKALRTARYAHPIYSPDYGVEMPEMFGRTLDPGLIGRLEAAVREALVVHDRISDVRNFSYAVVDPGDDALLVTFNVVLENGGEFGVDPLLVAGAEITSVPDPNRQREALATGLTTTPSL